MKALLFCFKSKAVIGDNKQLSETFNLANKAANLVMNIILPVYYVKKGPKRNADFLTKFLRLNVSFSIKFNF